MVFEAPIILSKMKKIKEYTKLSTKQPQEAVFIFSDSRLKPLLQIATEV